MAKFAYKTRIRRAVAGRIRRKILKELKYPSLDAFALEHHDRVSKATLYSFCNHDRDIRLSRLSELAEALEIPMEELFKGF